MNDTILCLHRISRKLQCIIHYYMESQITHGEWNGFQNSISFEKDVEMIGSAFFHKNQYELYYKDSQVRFVHGVFNVDTKICTKLS